MKTFEQWDSEFTKNNTPFDKSDVKLAYESGAVEKEKEMLEFAEWLVYWRETEKRNAKGSGGGRMPCSTEAALNYWKKNRLT